MSEHSVDNILRHAALAKDIGSLDGMLFGGGAGLALKVALICVLAILPALSAACT